MRPLSIPTISCRLACPQATADFGTQTRQLAPPRLGIYAIWYDGYGVGLPGTSPIRPDRIIRRLSELLL
jgi:hypothetical protein